MGPKFAGKTSLSNYLANNTNMKYIHFPSFIKGK